LLGMERRSRIPEIQGMTIKGQLFEDREIRWTYRRYRRGETIQENEVNFGNSTFQIYHSSSFLSTTIFKMMTSPHRHERAPQNLYHFTQKLPSVNVNNELKLTHCRSGQGEIAESGFWVVRDQTAKGKRKRREGQNWKCGGSNPGPWLC
jgi:hypothetical protein